MEAQPRPRLVDLLRRRAAGARRPARSSVGWLVLERHRRLGHQQPGRLGLRHHELRLLDRYRPRRHADLAPILFLFRQKWRTAINRSAEAMTIFAVMCAGLFPLLHTGRPVVRLLDLPVLPTTWAAVAELPSPARVGRVRGQHLLHHLGAVLVHGHGSRPRDVPRSRDEQPRATRLRHLSLGWRGSPRHWHRYETRVPDPRRPRDAAGALGALDRRPSTSPPRSSRAGTPRSSRRTSSPAPSSRASRWC